VNFINDQADQYSYVINSEAMKKLYATMKNRPTSLDEPKDLSREWHSDCSLLTSLYPCLIIQLTLLQAFSKNVPRTSVSCGCKTPLLPVVTRSGFPDMNCTSSYLTLSLLRSVS
jgi:hypothetical protein